VLSIEVIGKGLIVMYKKNKLMFFSLISIAIGITVAFIVIEIVLRILGIGYGRSAHISDPFLHHVNPKDFTFVAHSPSGEFEPFVLEYNKEGFRQRPIKNMNSVYRIALLGDSFTLSRELPYEKTFAGLLENACLENTSIYNFAVASYNPILYLVQWEREVKKFKPTHVILQLYTNDIADDTELSKIAQYDKDGKIIAIPGPGDDLLRKLAFKSYVIRYVVKLYLQLEWALENRNNPTLRAIGEYIESNPEITDLSFSYVKKLADIVSQYGAEFAITVIPSKYLMTGDSYDSQELEFSDKWKQWAEMNNIKFIDLVIPFHEASKSGKKLFFTNDIHFNENGSAVTADVIIKEYPRFFKTMNYFK
jgi:hypothetical protein